ERGLGQLLIDTGLIGAERTAALKHQYPPLRPFGFCSSWRGLATRRRLPGLGGLRSPAGGLLFLVGLGHDPGGSRFFMNQPWLTTRDWPVRARLGKPAKSRATSATSATVVNSPSTVSFSMTFFTTSSSEMPSSRACSGICLSTSGVRTKPGQMTLARTP